MSNATPEDIASQAVELLSRLQPHDALRHSVLRKYLLDLIVDDDVTGFREQVYKLVKPLPRKRRKIGDGLADRAISFLESRTERGPLNTNSFSSALSVLQNECHTSVEAYEINFAHEAGPSAARADLSFGTQTREAGVMSEYEKNNCQTHFYESSRRLTMLIIVYEIERIAAREDLEMKQTPAGRAEKRIAAAERTFSESSKVAMKRVREIRKCAQTYADVAKQRNGLGMLLMLGTQSRDIWEQKITAEALPLILEFCEIHLKDVMQRAERLQPVACDMVRDKFMRCGIDPVELRGPGHLFSAHFEQPQTPGTHHGCGPSDPGILLEDTISGAQLGRLEWEEWTNAFDHFDTIYPRRTSM